MIRLTVVAGLLLATALGLAEAQSTKPGLPTEAQSAKPGLPAEAQSAKAGR
jgi:hypothetical protein